MPPRKRATKDAPAAGPSTAAPPPPKPKPAPKPKAAGKPTTYKRKSAAQSLVDTASPTSTATSSTPSPAKRRKISSAPKLTSSQQTATSTSKYETAMRDGKPFWDIGDLNVRLSVGNEKVTEYVNVPIATQSPAGKRKKGKLGQSSSATMVVPEYDSDDDMPGSDEEDSLLDVVVAGEERSPSPVESLPEFVPTALPLLMRNLDNKPPLLVKSQRNWFPAYLVGFHPAMNWEDQKNRKDMWEVEAHPATGWKKPRKVNKANMMYLHDPAIATCTMGSIFSEERRFACDAPTRAASPDLPDADLPFPSSSDFADLSRTDQIRLVRPHLYDIINERYAPAKWRIDLFYRSFRSNLGGLVKEAKYGDITSYEVVQVIVPELQRWMMRGCHPETDAEAGAIPQGTDRFNSLTPVQKIAYIQSVLVPELIIRICIASSDTETLLSFSDQLPKKNGEGPALSEAEAGAEALLQLGGMDDVEMADAAPTTAGTAEKAATSVAARSESISEAEEPIEIDTDAQVVEPLGMKTPAAGQEAEVEVPKAPGAETSGVAGAEGRGEEAGEKLQAGEQNEPNAGYGSPADELEADTAAAPTSDGTGAEATVTADVEAAPSTQLPAATQPETSLTPTQPTTSQTTNAEASSSTQPIPPTQTDHQTPLTQATTDTTLTAPPTRTPAPAEIPESTQYALANLYLRALASESSAISWEFISLEIRNRRNQARAEQKLPAEDMSEFEKEREKLKNPEYEKTFFGGEAGGRVRRRVDYAHLDQGRPQPTGSPKRARTAAGGVAGTPTKKAPRERKPTKGVTKKGKGKGKGKAVEEDEELSEMKEESVKGEEGAPEEVKVEEEKSGDAVKEEVTGGEQVEEAKGEEVKDEIVLGELEEE